MATDEVADLRDGDTLLPGERHVLEVISAGAPLADAKDALDASSMRDRSCARRFFCRMPTARTDWRPGQVCPDVWRQAVSVFPVTATACGAAVTRREQNISLDILADPLYRDFRDAARAVGIHACRSTPILSDRHALDTLSVCSAHPGPPSEAPPQTAQKNRVSSASQAAVLSCPPLGPPPRGVCAVG